MLSAVVIVCFVCWFVGWLVGWFVSLPLGQKRRNFSLVDGRRSSTTQKKKKKKKERFFFFGQRLWQPWYFLASLLVHLHLLLSLSLPLLTISLFMFFYQTVATCGSIEERKAINNKFAPWWKKKKVAFDFRVSLKRFLNFFLFFLPSLSVASFLPLYSLFFFSNSFPVSSSFFFFFVFFFFLLLLLLLLHCCLTIHRPCSCPSSICCPFTSSPSALPAFNSSILKPRILFSFHSFAPALLPHIQTIKQKTDGLT